MRVLVTGAAGFIGSHVVRQLVGRGDDVHALTRTSSSRARLPGLEGAITWHVVEPGDRSAVGASVRAIGPDAAVHLAWYAEPGRYLSDAAENLRSLSATTDLLEALFTANCSRVVLAGTGLETRPPETIYAAAKTAAHTVAAQLRRDGLAATCAHVFYLYGPGEDPRRVVPTVIRALLRGDSVAVGQGRESRDYLHVSDVASAFCNLIDRDPGPSADICTGRTVTLRHVFEIIGRETGRPDLIRYGDRARDGLDFPATGDLTQLAATGWRPTITLDAGIRDAIRYWAANPATMTGPQVAS